ncbi:preprotein translocase subunit SecA [Candidatus Formimonas warabiya]|uniref:Protein translocase subunit SecA n=1 Tax=Formimonas warabiya TaxID=1761012 RepID=A0A3G1KU05_FORW1|nr:preprotein translocase subunit SecA [Candidatus Formimonas warabiya]ATW25931.1 preprotein translocase subunit SecA [Candidatus Formimonas warabiya]
MLKFLKSLLDDNARDIKKYSKVVEEINALEPEIEKLSDPDLQGKTAQLKEKLAAGASLNDILPEAFAVVREASRRVLGMRHFDVQLIGGMVLHHGRIAEMKTGEGKTLVATLPVYLNSLTEKGVHVVTVNDYLATRDSEWMGKIYKFLGLSVGLIVHGLDFEERKNAYRADVTYGTNNEFGFDYLRDNMSIHPDHMVQRELNYAIVDEVDSILIDEARTPLIISGQADKPTQLYYTVAKVIPRLKKEDDFAIDEKARVVTLTEQGVSRVEQMLGVENLYDNANMEISHHVNQALKAYTLFKRDRDYVVKDGEVIIVDEFTGRLMFGRRYSEGLHQAIEAKEGVKIERESQTLATITFQNYFRMYKKLSGMTGTAATEEEEFRKIYGMDVVVAPTNMPMVRKDHPDVIYRTAKGKINAVVEEIVARHDTGQPVLVGTISIEKSEQFSEALKKRGVTHQVLNAKFHEMEAEIVAQAGRHSAVTIATNMAGRGTDILLGGNPEFLAHAEARKAGKELDDEEMRPWIAKYKEQTDEERRKVVELGGLHIIGTERHESRRIDNQLRGRSGRQGDPGSSKFFISMEDDLMRLFGAENVTGMMDKLGMDDSMPIDHPIISKSIESAQKRVEAKNFELRKHVLEYDDVMNQQREIIYEQRRQVLTGENLKDTIYDMIHDVVDRTVASYAGGSPHPEEWDLKGLLESAHLFLPNHALTEEDLKMMHKDEIPQMFEEKVREFYEKREGELGEETLRELERVVILKVVDSKWMDHLDAMDQLRQGIGLRAYGQKDPLVEYKFEAYDMFQEMIGEIQSDVVRYLMRVNVVEAPKERTNISENRAEDQVKKPVRKEKQIGRNDPCPCGSGKKYKKCCGAQE